jgi:hypothetical protein
MASGVAAQIWNLTPAGIVPARGDRGVGVAGLEADAVAPRAAHKAQQRPFHHDLAVPLLELEQPDIGVLFESRIAPEAPSHETDPIGAPPGLAVGNAA